MGKEKDRKRANATGHDHISRTSADVHRRPCIMAMSGWHDEHGEQRLASKYSMLPGLQEVLNEYPSPAPWPRKMSTALHGATGSWWRETSISCLFGERQRYNEWMFLDRQAKHSGELWVGDITRWLLDPYFRSVKIKGSDTAALEACADTKHQRCERKYFC